jgi:hypothetical protein
MKAKKRKSIRRTPDVTVEGDSLTVFTDKPRGDIAGTSKGVVTSYDPAAAALDAHLKRAATEKKSIQGLARILEDCLRTAGGIKNQRGTELVRLLRNARRQVELIDLK